jgi:hypothetical protein
MRLEVQAIIIGDFVISEPVIANYHPYEFKISKDEKNHYISVSKKVTDYKDYITKYEGASNGVPQFRLTPYEIYEDMISWLQYIESMGAFNIGVKSIDWNESKITWIPEIEEEQGIMPLLSHQRQFDKKKPPRRLSQSNLSMLITHRRFLKEIYVPFTYFRIGKNLFDERKYYFAFINFFMMLEYCFANGKFKQDAVINEFNKSHILNKSISSALEIFTKHGNNQAHLKWLKNECVRLKVKLNNEGIILLLVKYRGELSHASKISEKYLFHDDKLFSLSFVANLICFLVCGNLQIGNCLFGQQKEDYLHGVKRGSTL